MTKTTHGTIRGRSIELAEDLGFPEEQQVEVSVRAVIGDSARKPGDGLRRCAGALANEWTEEDDRILATIHQERKRDTRRLDDWLVP